MMVLYDERDFCGVLLLISMRTSIYNHLLYNDQGLCLRTQGCSLLDLILQQGLQQESPILF